MKKSVYRTTFRTDAWRIRFGDLCTSSPNTILAKISISPDDIKSIQRGEMYSDVQSSDFAYHNGDLFSSEALKAMGVDGSNPYDYLRTAEQKKKPICRSTRKSTQEDAWRILFGDLKKKDYKTIMEILGLTKPQISGIKRRNAHSDVEKADFKMIEGEVRRTNARPLENGLPKIRDCKPEDAWFVRFSNFRGETTKKLSEMLGLSKAQVARLKYADTFSDVKASDFEVNAEGKVISTK